MSITQVGVATVSDELIAFLKEQIKNGTIEWKDLIDTPDYSGVNDKFLRANTGNGSSSMSWEEMPPSGFDWIVQSTNTTAVDRIGYLADGGITISLPPDPIDGFIVAISDRNGEFDTNPVNISTGSKLIEGNSDLLLDLRNAFIQLVFDGTSWKILQVNNPFNIQEITEESFPGGLLQYTLSRIPPTRTAILVTVNGAIVPSSQYSVVGNVLSFGTAKVGTVYVRHLGLPVSNKISEVPVGAMMYFPNGEYVDGWLDATGSKIYKSTYPELVQYLSRDPEAEYAYLPDPRGKIIRTWDNGRGLDTSTTTSIPSDLSDNTWGKWLDTAPENTIMNIWDSNTQSGSSVNFGSSRVGYAFDVPVTVNNVSITTEEPRGNVYVPSYVLLKASVDGVTWITASSEVYSINNSTKSINSTTNTPYRYWAIFGYGGLPYTNDSSQYWKVTDVTFTGVTNSRIIGGIQEESIGDLDLYAGSSSLGKGNVQSGTGDVSLIVGGSTDINGGGSELVPSNVSYSLKIKAFHYQSGSLSNTNVTALRDDVSRMYTSITDLETSVNVLETVKSDITYTDTTSIAMAIALG